MRAQTRSMVLFLCLVSGLIGGRTLCASVISYDFSIDCEQGSAGTRLIPFTLPGNLNELHFEYWVSSDAVVGAFDNESDQAGEGRFSLLDVLLDGDFGLGFYDEGSRVHSWTPGRSILLHESGPYSTQDVSPDSDAAPDFVGDDAMLWTFSGMGASGASGAIPAWWLPAPGEGMDLGIFWNDSLQTDYSVTVPHDPCRDVKWEIPSFRIDARVTMNYGPVPVPDSGGTLLLLSVTMGLLPCFILRRDAAETRSRPATPDRTVS